MVPYRSDYLEHFVKAANEDNASSFDSYFQNDHSTQAQYQPFSANSGFYYARNNHKTRYFFGVASSRGPHVAIQEPPDRHGRPAE